MNSGAAPYEEPAPAARQAPILFRRAAWFGRLDADRLTMSTPSSSLLAHPLTAQALIVSLGITSAYAAWDGSLFAWHPTLMTLGLCASLSGSAWMKARGVRWHAFHSSLQMMAVYSMVGGAVVMYRVKELNGGDAITRRRIAPGPRIKVVC